MFTASDTKIRLKSTLFVWECRRRRVETRKSRNGLERDSNEDFTKLNRVVDVVWCGGAGWVINFMAMGDDEYDTRSAKCVLRTDNHLVRVNKRFGACTQ